MSRFVTQITKRRRRIRGSVICFGFSVFLLSILIHEGFRNGHYRSTHMHKTEPEHRGHSPWSHGRHADTSIYGLVNENMLHFKWLFNWTQINHTRIGLYKGHEGKTFLRRINRVNEVCTMYHNKSRHMHPFVAEPQRPDFRKLLIDSHHHIAYCPTFKAASSTWTTHFITLGQLLHPDLKIQEANYSRHRFPPRPHKLTLMNQARKYFPEMQGIVATKSLLVCTAFMIVRHPFERLLSAYRDKIEHRQGREFYYRKYGQRIVAKCRRSSHSPGNATTSSTTEKPEPTWEEFVRFILETRTLDEHWRPYTGYCSPCLMRYDAVLKWETLHEDQEHLLRVLNLTSLLSTEWRNVNRYGSTSKEIAKTYFSQLPRHLTEKLYEYYRVDFDMFDYSAREYIDVGYVENKNRTT